MFGVVFGDIGHGLILLLVSIKLFCLSASKKKFWDGHENTEYFWVKKKVVGWRY